MNRQTMYGAVLMACVMMGLSGCMPKMTMEDMKQMRPERPAELDKLNAFVGTWQGSGTAKMIGIDEPMELKGTSETTWEVNNWYLVEHAEYEMGEMGTMKGVGVWSWDSRAKKYRTWWFDDFGGTGTGTITYREACNCWCMSVRGNSPMGSTRGKGCITFKDDETMEWTWQEWPAWDLFGLFKFMDMSGTSKRQ